MRQTINKGRTSYYPNSLEQGYSITVPESEHSYVHYPERVDGRKVAVRSETFKDYLSQATLFWRSLSPAEQQHLVDACRFELGKVESVQVREREIGLFDHVDHDLAVRVAEGIGVTIPKDNPRPGVLPPADRRQTGIPGLSVSEAQADGGVANAYGIVIASNTSNLDAFSKEFISALAQARHWVRPNHEQVPA